MTVSTKHLFAQGPVLKVLAGTAITAIKQQLGADRGPSTMPPLPGPPITQTIVPRSPDLLRDYIRHVGGDPSSYRGCVPAHFFPQWGFPLQAKTLAGVPYPMFKVLNGGCRLQMNAPLPAGEPLQARAWLQDVDDNGRRAVLHQVIVTGTAAEPEAVVADLYAIVPLGDPGDRSGRDGAASSAAPRKPKEKARVPAHATELARWRLRLDAGLDFAKLTGDFNPVHWVTPYARAFGFRNRILHGFSTMARAIEGLNRNLYAGSVRTLRQFDCQFTRPLVLPAKVGLYVHDGKAYVGDAPGGPAYLVASYEAHPELA